MPIVQRLRHKNYLACSYLTAMSAARNLIGSGCRLGQNQHAAGQDTVNMIG